MTPNTDRMDDAGLNWRKSTASNSGNCVEAAGAIGDRVLVRDSKDKSGPLLAFTRAEWDAFVQGVRSGEFDTQALLP